MAVKKKPFISGQDLSNERQLRPALKQPAPTAVLNGKNLPIINLQAISNPIDLQNQRNQQLAEAAIRQRQIDIQTAVDENIKKIEIQNETQKK